MSSNVKISVLDLMPHRSDQSQHQTMLNTIDAARAAESYGYERFWVAEHHNAGSLLSSATVVVMAEIAAATERIRVGSGGIMLPNHAPYVVAEQFGTLNAFHPGRIDLGVGRAPGTDPMTAAALRRDDSAAMSFPAEVQQLPLYILGSSLFGAQLAAQLGLPYAFASHFAPAMLQEAVDTYRANFKPSEHLEQPYVMVGVSAMLADTDERARYLYTTQQQHFLGVVRGNLSFAPPVEDMDAIWTDAEKMHIERMTAEAIVGSPATAQARIEDLVARTGAEELIVMTEAWEHEDRLRSYELLSQLPVVSRAS